MDHGKIVLSNVNQDFGPKGLIGSFVAGSAAERQARELLVRHGILPADNGNPLTPARKLRSSRGYGATLAGGLALRSSLNEAIYLESQHLTS